MRKSVPAIILAMCISGPHQLMANTPVVDISLNGQDFNKSLQKAGYAKIAENFSQYALSAVALQQFCYYAVSTIGSEQTAEKFSSYCGKTALALSAIPAAKKIRDDLMEPAKSIGLISVADQALGLKEVSAEEVEPFKNLSYSTTTLPKILATRSQYLNAKSRGGTFNSVLLYGPPGTGKTAFAKSFAHEGFKVFEVSGHRIASESRFDLLLKVLKEQSSPTNFLLFKGKKPRKIIVLVDEAGMFFEALDSIEGLKNLFKTKMGTPSADFAFMFTTNEILDLFDNDNEPVHRRFSTQILVENPGPELRRKLLAKFISRYITRVYPEDLNVPDDLFENESFCQKYDNLSDGKSPDNLRALAGEISERFFMAAQAGEAGSDIQRDIILEALKQSLQQDIWIEQEVKKQAARKEKRLEKEAKFARLRAEIRSASAKKRTEPEKDQKAKDTSG